MTDIATHPATKKLLSSYVSEPSHALCLYGEKGVGLRTIALDLGVQLSGNEKLVTVIEPEKGVIPIDRVRQLYEQTRSIQTGRRCIVIDDADTMGVDAQNALLKLLEEPVKNIHFILTSHSHTKLLPTIRSRTQNIQVMSIGEDASKQIIAGYNLSATEQLQVLFLASGKPAEIIRLCTDKEYFSERTMMMSDARTFLQADTYDRLTVLKKYSDRVGALTFLETCSSLLSYSLLKQKNVAATDNMDLFERVMTRIDANGHVKTQLMYLVTKLS